MSEVVRPAGWHNWNKRSAETTTFYAGYANAGPGAAPAAREDWMHWLEADDAAAHTPLSILSGDDGWDPVNAR